MKGFCHRKGLLAPGYLIKAGILSLLSAQELHGYEIMSLLQERFPDLFAFTGISRMGKGYRILRMLEEEGYVQSRWDIQDEEGAPKRLYSITEKGRRAKDELAGEIEGAIRNLESFLKYLKNEK